MNRQDPHFILTEYDFIFMAAPRGKLMSLNVSHLDIEGPVCSSRAVVDAESTDNAFDEEKGFFLHPPGIAQQPHAAPWFALAAPEMPSFGVQWMIWGRSGSSHHACSEVGRAGGKTSPASQTRVFPAPRSSSSF